MTDHAADDLPELLAGSLGREQTGRVVAHLHDCESCRRDLVTVAAATGVLRFSARTLPPLVSADQNSESDGVPEATTLPPLAHPGRRLPARRHLVGAAAAITLLATAGGAAVALRDSGSPTRPPAQVQSAALTSPSGTPARGVVTLGRPAGSTDLSVSTVGLDVLRPGQFYEVWLFDPATSKMVGVGVLGPNGAARLSVPASLITSYRAIDISLQRDNGDPRHSSLSVLRGRYS